MAQPYRHTFLDDLESALWVMVSEYLRQVKLHHEVNGYEKEYLNAMMSEDDWEIYHLKETMAQMFPLCSQYHDDGLDFAGFNGLFAEWLAAIDSCNCLELFAKDAYQKVLGVGFRYLENYPECWDLPWREFFKSKKRHDIVQRVRRLSVIVDTGEKKQRRWFRRKVTH